MWQRSLRPLVARLAILFFCLSPVLYSAETQAQTTESTAELRQRILDLTAQTKYVAALPLLEKFVAAEPNDAEMRFQLGFALIAQANNTRDATIEKQLRRRARNEFIKSKQLGVNRPIVDALIESMSAEGSVNSRFTNNIEAN